MQFLNDVKQKTVEFAEANASALLTAGGVVGTVATAVLAWRGGYKYAEKLGDAREELMDKDDTEFVTVQQEDNLEIRIPKVPTKDKLFLIAPQVVPPVVVGGLTVASVVMANRVSAQKAAALAAAYGLAERNLSEYKEKVAEKLTGPKKIAIDDELAQDRINKNGNQQNLVIIEGEVLCYDEATNRYFRGTMESIKRAVNATNAEILNHDYADATFFYHELGLEKTVWSEEVGWNHDHLLELKFTTAEAPDGRPCISIDFATFPRQDFRPKHY